MWQYEKKLQYPVNIKNPNPKLAKVIISQLGGLYAKKILLHQLKLAFFAKFNWRSNRIAKIIRIIEKTLLTTYTNRGIIL